VNLTDISELALARNNSDTETGTNTETVAPDRDHAYWPLASLEAAPAATTAAAISATILMRFPFDR